ncbi:hypothetical protein CHS0354_003653 [Potamilus streckersoni]|uniref:C-type lectin domain-containing protein n=1 Tax=Potamilus streckersoni TaxID=2493646 RepID=A0AAE0S8V9_9BIVA|nr:hypothetical protein CHS0354_003653 [Potamilus streckersoni]
MNVWMLYCALFFTNAFVFVNSESERIIYTLFSTPKTWNEARDICETQNGQLLKLTGQDIVDRLKYLDKAVWNNATFASNQAMWHGLHQPPGMHSFMYQDCSPVPSSINTINITNSYCTVTSAWDLNFHERTCNTKNIFVCQRFEGACWYEPIQGKRGTGATTTVSLSNVQPTDCALECHNISMTLTVQECWAFAHNEVNFTCELYLLNGTVTSPSVYYLDTGKYVADLDYALYVKRCVEGSLDENSYTDVENTSIQALSGCAYNSSQHNYSYSGSICYCSSSDQPPIPEPLSLEEKVAKILEALTIDSKNTSAAIRLLVSVQDDRPSAHSLGLLGVALLCTVFGGLLLLDLNLLYEHLRNFIKRF